jgi:nucleotide sugar dehydrogenase
MAPTSSTPAGPPESFRACVIGLGKIGLPLAVQFAHQAIPTIGVDINEAVVSIINGGEPPFPGEDNLDLYLKKGLEAGLFTATTSTIDAVRASNVVIIVVPLIVDHDTKVPDFRAIDAATQSVAKGLQPGTLVAYETTLPIGTTRNRFAKALAETSGLKLGEELFVCFSPERVSSGRIFRDLARYPKLVGGIDDASTEFAVAFYKAALTFDDRPDLNRPNGVWRMDSTEASELAKLAETTYRDINIAFANELARHCDAMGVDVGQVIAASNSQPFSHIHQPGIAVGGHCIPVYPHLYLQGDPDAQMPKTSRIVNDRMPAYCLDRLVELSGPLDGKRVAILGLAYRGGVKETAFSGAWPLLAELTKRGATALVHDPLYTDDELAALSISPFHLGDPVDFAVVQTDHVEYRQLGPAHLPGVKAIVDGRNVVENIQEFESVGASWSILGRRSSAKSSETAPAQNNRQGNI